MSNPKVAYFKLQGEIMEYKRFSLSDNFLEGEIPVELENLANLENLYLHNNQLSGEVPNIFHEMNNLVHLTLFENQLSGNVPESLCNIYNNIEYLGLYGNLFCPPYPSCFTYEDLGSQDTTNCDFAFINKENNLLDFSLFNVYPNPFNPITNIKFDLIVSSNVSIEIFNVRGENIYSDMSKLTPGNYLREWNGKGFPSGIYFINVKIGKSSFTQKALLVK